jgi:hypothetical protein
MGKQSRKTKGRRDVKEGVGGHWKYETTLGEAEGRQQQNVTDGRWKVVGRATFH